MRIGLTGHYASGKSTVSLMFKDLGAEIIDTDTISREIVKVGTDIYQQICQSFGKGILNNDLTINRRKLGSLVFSDTEKLKVLNSITHPPILNLTLERSSDASTVYMINVPLLYQAGYDYYMDKVIIVTASSETMISRGSIRDSLTKSEAKKRLESQNSINKYLNQADYIIDNSSNIDNTQDQVKEIWNSLIISLKRK